jgi:putative serine protease PepD
MQTWLRSHLVSAVAGGLVVAGTFLAVGVTGRRSTQTIVEQGPVMARQTASTSPVLTAHDIYVREAGSIVSVRSVGGRNRTGSGFLVSRNGYVLTTSTLTAGATGATIEFSDDVARRAQVVDADNGVAVLRANLSGVPAIVPLPCGESANVRVGDPVLALGDPVGYDRTLTTGIVSSLQRQFTDLNGSTIANVIETDAPVSPGSAGGPLLDGYGRVIGITGAAGPVSFAVPIDTAKQILPGVC